MALHVVARLQKCHQTIQRMDGGKKYWGRQNWVNNKRQRSRKYLQSLTIHSAMNSIRFEQTIDYQNTKNNLLEHSFMFLNLTGTFFNSDSDLALFGIWRLKFTIILKNPFLALGNLTKLVFWLKVGSQYVLQLQNLHQGNLGSFFSADNLGRVGVIFSSISYCNSTSYYRESQA